MTAQHTVAKGFNQMTPPERTITVALYMSKVFDTINIHLLKSCYRQTFQAQSYSSSQTTLSDAKHIPHRNHTSIQRQFKTSVSKSGVLSPTLFNIYTAEYPKHRFRSWYTQMTSPSPLHTQARVHPRNTYNHTYTKYINRHKNKHAPYTYIYCL